MKNLNFLEVSDLTREQIEEIIELSFSRDYNDKPLKDKGVALVFEKPSSRTRNSMEMAVKHLGGHPVYMQASDIDLGSRESVEDLTNSLAQYHEIICARVHDHVELERMVACEVAPIVNMLSDSSHPLQALADIVTMREEFGDLKGKRVAYIGDPNNVARSLAVVSKMFDMEFMIATPSHYRFSEDDCIAIQKFGGVDLTTDDPITAVRNADVVYTDVWVSMGNENEAKERLKSFSGYTVNSELLQYANEDAIVMHCLPAKRGQEIADEVFNSKQSRIWQQAQNRMHSSRALLSMIATSR